MGVEPCADPRKGRRQIRGRAAFALGLACAAPLPACAAGNRAEAGDGDKSAMAKGGELDDRPTSQPTSQSDHTGPWPQPAGWTAAELSATAAWLKDEHPERRRIAIAALSSLGEDSLTAIGERIAQLHAEGRSAEAMGDALHAFAAQRGEATARGGWRDPVDHLLRSRRGDDVGALVEALLLLQSLSSIEHIDAGMMLAEWINLYGGVMRPLLDESVAAIGAPLLPALLRLRSHPTLEIKRWAQGHARELGAQSPAQVLTEDDPHLLAELVTAYSLPLDFAAMPYLVRLTAHPRLQVRAAARAAVERFGQNAIWQVREFYEEWTERPLDPALAIAEARMTLYAVLDAEDQGRLAQQRHAQAGLQALGHGDPTSARRELDAALERWPEPDLAAQIARAYATLGQRALSAGQLTDAEHALQRALWLGESPPPDPSSTGSPTRSTNDALQAQLAFVRAELDLSRGVADAYAYRKVLHTLPDHAGAQRARAYLERHTRGARQAWMVGLLSGLALAGSAAFLLAFRRTLPRHKKPRRETHWHVRRRT